MKLLQVMDQLRIPSRSTNVYLHINAKNLLPLANRAQIFEALDTYFDSRSTLSMPSFPFPGNRYWGYLESSPEFDLYETPSRVSIISDLFRRRDGTLRSIHPWFSIASRGPLAKDLLSEHHLDFRTFGPKSPLAKIMDRGGVVVGLGCDCNTNSFAHLPDNRLLQDSSFNFELYEKNPVTSKCIDYDRRVFSVTTDVLERSIGKRIKPRKMKHLYEDHDFYRAINLDGVEFYAMDIQPFVDFTVEANRSYVSNHGTPLYYD